jgi:hypothetical protein
MSIEQANVIDFMSTDRVSGYITLTATDHLEWGSREHLLLVQEKLNSYLAFVESGEIFASYPTAKGKPIKFDIVCQFEPDEEAIRFFSLCGEAIKTAGFDFGYRIQKI